MSSDSAIERAIGALERVPYSVLAIPLRLAVATVFWNSGMTKLANWDATLQLFEDDYKVPLLPPELAAHIAAGIEPVSYTHLDVYKRQTSLSSWNTWRAMARPSSSRNASCR